MPSRVALADRSALTRLGFALVLFAASTLGSSQTITEFSVPTPNADLHHITVGPDGALWFNESAVGKVGRITVDGTITEFQVIGANFGIAAGPDGNLWITGDGEVRRLTPAGALTHFVVPAETSGDPAAPWGIVAGPDGAMWFSDLGSRIGRITMSGVVTMFPVTYSLGFNQRPNGPYGIASGPDGNIWYATYIGGSVGRITPAGVFTDFPTFGAFAITNGPDGALWCTSGSGAIGRISTSGDARTFLLPTVSSTYEITSGPDGNLWFAEPSDNKIGRLTPTGVLTEFPIPTSVPNPFGNGSFPFGITAGPDGNIWFTEEYGNKIGRIDVNGGGGNPLCGSDAHTLCLNNNRFAVTAAWQASPLGPIGLASGARITDKTGYFWFVDPDNVELVVKVLDGCFEPFDAYWVFASGLTNLGVELTVTDTQTGAFKVYSNPIGTPFAPILDTGALRTCP